MTMTDPPIADMLTRLRNANQAFHDSTSMPHSKIKVGIAEILKSEGYISDFEVAEPKAGEVGKTLNITLKYGQNRERSIAGVRRISKPGLRVYAKSNELPPKVLGGLGIAIISTSQGLLTDRDANSKSVGGGKSSPTCGDPADERRLKCRVLADCQSPSRPVSTSPWTDRTSR